MLTSDYLETLRMGTHEYEVVEKKFRDHITSRGLKLSDFGSSEEELISLRQRGARLLAAIYLRRIRYNSDDRCQNFTSMKQELEKAKCDLEGIGTDKHEMDRLVPKSD